MSFNVYNHEKIEKKWQKIWRERESFRAEIDPEKPKYYVLDMFPYPSGSGLHVGHLAGYSVTDVLARYHRQKGYNVLHPMGWDSFGLPAEQYAIRTGVHPAKTTEKNIQRFRQQLQALGFSYDWTREFRTSDPSYYKWTQWIFTQLYERGLAYQAEMMVNYCPQLGTVLANEEVENGCAKEGGHPIERKTLRQWVLKITDYAERLINDLDGLDWPEHVKQLQKNWIGRNEGVNLYFQEESTGAQIITFTTRIDTLFGISYVVLAPEHSLVNQITTLEQKEAVDLYRKSIAQKSDRERMSKQDQEKSGVWTGTYAIHPVTGDRLPLWIADYVLADYGTGAVMAVPAHDARDFAFAQKYGLPIRPVIFPGEEELLSVHVSAEDHSTFYEELKRGVRCWEGGGVCNHSGGNGSQRFSERLILDRLSVEEAKLEATTWLELHRQGKKTITYKLRDWLFSRQRYWGEPFPLLYFKDGSQRSLTLDELPLVPPQLEEYAPLGSGQSPLAAVKEWMQTTDHRTRKTACRESDVMPQWAGSCWYYLRFCDPHNRERAWGEREEKYWMSVDMYVGGMEHAVLHLLYARFWHKVLYDCGLVSHPEPFSTYRNIGLVVSRSYQKENGSYVSPDDVEKKEGHYIEKSTGERLRSQIEKMSKSKLNGLSPDELIEEYGADTVRLFEMFLGPVDKEKVWDSEAISGCRRFLSRVYKLANNSSLLSEETSEEEKKLGYRMLHGVIHDIERLHLNTAIAKMMEFLNDFQKCGQEKGSSHYSRTVLLWLMQCLYPFVPHIASELWEVLGGGEDISLQPFPTIDASYLVEEKTTWVIQVNGKVRGKLELPADLNQEEALKYAQKNPHIQNYLQAGRIKKVIYIAKKHLLNIVIAN